MRQVQQIRSQKKQKNIRKNLLRKNKKHSLPRNTAPVQKMQRKTSKKLHERWKMKKPVVALILTLLLIAPAIAATNNTTDVDDAYNITSAENKTNDTEITGPTENESMFPSGPLPDLFGKDKEPRTYSEGSQKLGFLVIVGTLLYALWKTKNKKPEEGTDEEGETEKEDTDEEEDDQTPTRINYNKLEKEIEEEQKHD